MCQWLPKSKGWGFLLGAWHDVHIHEVLGKIFSWNFDSLACSAYSLSWTLIWVTPVIIRWDAVNPFAWNGTIFKWFSVSCGIVKPWNQIFASIEIGVSYMILVINWIDRTWYQNSDCRSWKLQGAQRAAPLKGLKIHRLGQADGFVDHRDVVDVMYIILWAFEIHSHISSH
jgi:hypothetical protein